MNVLVKDFKFFPFATNKDGSKIFCRLSYKKKTVLKGFYDYERDRFIIKDYVKQNFPQGTGKPTIKRILRFYLALDYDWEL